MPIRATQQLGSMGCLCFVFRNGAFGIERGNTFGVTHQLGRCHSISEDAGFNAKPQNARGPDGLGPAPKEALSSHSATGLQTCNTLGAYVVSTAWIDRRAWLSQVRGFKFSLTGMAKWRGGGAVLVMMEAGFSTPLNMNYCCSLEN